jgi:hypothetical protein
MKVGKLNLELVKQPVDLEQQLLDLTGCAPATIAEHLAHPCLASAVASALLPFVKSDAEGQRISRHELAQAIAGAGVDEVRARVHALYEVANGKA